MKSAAEKTFSGWHKTLAEGFEECALTSDTRFALLKLHPLDDYYFAAAVALEAAKIRQLFGPEDSAELLSLIGEHVDALAGRTDRGVSDIVFFLIGRIETTAAGETEERPYDQVVKAILQRLGVDRIEATHRLMSHAIYRHTLGEPLALGVPHWWQRFHDKYVLAKPVEAPPQDQTITVAAPAASPRRRVPRRATAF